jgi:hypothetical protein
MTRKDYVLIADTFNRAMGNPEHFYVSNEPQYIRGVKSAAVALANELAADNPRFDRERFLRAAGVQS